MAMKQIKIGTATLIKKIVFRDEKRAEV